MTRQSLSTPYQPDDAEYRRNLLCFAGTRVSHLPAALFELPEILRQQYGRSGRCVVTPLGLTFHREEKLYYEDEFAPDGQRILRPDACQMEISTYGDLGEPELIYLSVLLRGTAVWNPAPGVPGRNRRAGRQRPDDPLNAAPRGHALVLRINKGMRSRYYFTVRRFQKANKGKYIVPGLLPAAEQNWRVIVFDTEMERPYPIQFAGILLEKTESGWKELERLNLYLKLPEGKSLSRDVKRVTRLRDEVLEEKGLSEKEADQQIQSFLQKADLLCGHAVLADMEIMRTSFVRQQLRLPYSLRRHEMIDTQVLLAALYHLDGAVALEKAARMTEIEPEGENAAYHDAETDASVTAGIFMKLEPDFRRKFGTEPVVEDCMMHSPRQLQLLGKFSLKAQK